MNIYVKINQTFDNEKTLKAFATLFVEKQLAVTGIRVLDSRNGLCVMMPSRQDNKGEYRDVCFPITAEFRKEINEAVLKAYKDHLANG
ncbi:MAG: SpoVG family protein [Lachnospiraceae bacterium]